MEFLRKKCMLVNLQKRFGMKNCDIVLTPMVEQPKLKLDLVGKPVDHTDYRSMIGSLMPLVSKRFCFNLTAYSDADYTGCHLDRKTKSEYVAVSSCCAQVLWMRTQLTDYGFFYDKVPIYCDSKSAIAISCNQVHHTRTKHIDVRSHEKSVKKAFQVKTDSPMKERFDYGGQGIGRGRGGFNG
nr:hypothetical protein [Tanacetum cinerariifolium]